MPSALVVATDTNVWLCSEPVESVTELPSFHPVWKKSSGLYVDGVASFEPQLENEPLLVCPYVFWNSGVTNGEKNDVLLE